MKKLYILVSATLLSACSTAFDLGANVKPGNTLGNYQITSLQVVPANASIAQDKDFHSIKPMLEQELVRAFTNVGVGRPAAGLKVELTSISAEMNAFTAAMVGDAYRLNGRAHIWQNTPTNVVTDVKVAASTGPYGAGLIGVFNAATTDNQDELAYRNKLAALFAQEVRGAIYPEYDN